VDKNIKFLVVEDSYSSRMMIVEIIYKIGFKNIVEAVDGQDAFEKLEKENDIDLIITDWNMPNINGLELTKMVRSSDKFKHIPIIMATAQGEKEKKDELINAGANAYLSKPFSFIDIKNAILKLISKNDILKKNVFEYKKPKLIGDSKIVINVAHIQVTDHIILGVLKHLINTGNLNPKHFHLETHCMHSWNPVYDHIEQGKVEAAFILAPMAMDLYSYGIPIKLILLAHKNGSKLVRKKDSDIESLKQYFKSKSFLLPHIMSVQYIMSEQYFRKLGLQMGVVGKENVDIFIEVVPPVNMPEYMVTNKEVAGFMAAEPIGSKAIYDDTAECLFISGKKWKDHPCCVLTVLDQLIIDYPEAIQEFVNMLVQAGLFVKENPAESAEACVKFLDPEASLGFTTQLIEDIITTENGLTTDNLIPDIKDFELIQQYMVNEMHIGNIIDLEKFIIKDFGQKAYNNIKF